MHKLTYSLITAALALAVVQPAQATTVGAANATASAAPTAISARRANPWGLTLVRFKNGSTDQQMKDAIAQAGGEIVTSVGKLRAISVLPKQADFATKIKANSNVQAAFVEKIISNIPGPDAAGYADSITGKNNPELGSPGANPPPDPWHNAISFWGETNPEGILQWDDNRMNVPAAWSRTLGDRTVRVAVLDTGVQGSHKELLANYDNQTSANTIPCNLLTRQFGPLGQKDCSSEDTEGHGTWVASRIAGAANGFASNGVAPGVQVIGYKVLSTMLGGGLTSWIVAGMVDACDHDVDLINMSLGGFDDPVADADDVLLWVDAVNYCRAKGTAILASAGNDHVRINRVSMTIGGVPLTNVGRVDEGNEGISSIPPGTSPSNYYQYDLRGLIETPAGVPGVIMVSSTSNANGELPAGYSLQAGIQKPTVGLADQLAYYSNYGARVDIAAPGGARKLGLPRYDGGPADILYGGWGTLGALDASGEICTDPSLASPLTFACFKVQGAGFGWLQGTSMSSPNATGVAALTLAAHHELQGNPDGLLTKLQVTARTNMVNQTGPNDPNNKTPSFTNVACPDGYCHLQYGPGLIPFSDAYGAGIVNAGAAVQ